MVLLDALLVALVLSRHAWRSHKLQSQFPYPLFSTNKIIIIAIYSLLPPSEEFVII